MKAGLFSSGTEVDAKITSRVTAARLKVQSYQLPVRTLSNREITPTPNPFLREFRHRPTVVSLATQTWQIISPTKQQRLILSPCLR